MKWVFGYLSANSMSYTKFLDSIYRFFSASPKFW